MSNSNFKPTVQLSLYTLIQKCSNDPKQANVIYQFFNTTNHKNIIYSFNTFDFYEDFSSYVTCYNNGNYIVGTIKPSYEEFLLKLLIILNAKKEEQLIDDDELTNKLLKRLINFENIKNIEELAENFPIIYKDFNIWLESYSTYIEQSRQNTSCILNSALKEFITSQKEVYKSFIYSRKKYLNKINSTNFNHYFRKNFNMDKVALYIIHEYLYKCEHSKDENVIKKYLTLINKYLESDFYDKTIYLELDKNYIINLDSIKIRVKKIIEKIDGSESIVDWVLVPEDEIVRRESNKKSTSRKITMSKEKVKNLISKGESRNNFYDCTNYLVKVMGQLKNNGYFAYIYPNGEVIMDRKYEEGKKSTATGNIAFNIKACNFEELSNLGKIELRNNPLAKKIIHSKNWKDRVTEIITKEGTNEDQEAAKSLIKKLKKKSS